MLIMNWKISVDLLNCIVILIILYCCVVRFIEMFIRVNGISFEGINIYFRRINYVVCNKF